MCGRRLRCGRSVLSVVAGLFCILGLAFLAGCREEDAEYVVRTLDDMPRHTYPVNRTVSELFADREALAELASRVRADITSDLERYEIEDRAVLVRSHRILVYAAIVESDFPEALAQIEHVRQLASSDAARLMAYFPLEAILKARLGAGDDEAKFRILVKEELRKQLDAMPWETAGDGITQYKGIADTMSDALMVSDMLERLDSQASLMNGILSSEMAEGLLSVWAKVELMLPVKSELSNACGSVIRERRVAKKDVWPERSITLGVSENLTPVIVAIWDSGVDVSLFGGRLWVNVNETLDWLDNDGNGFVNDIHGIAHGLYGETLRDVMAPSGEMTISTKEAERRYRGCGAVFQARETDDAAYVRGIMEGLDRAGMAAFMKDGYLYSTYAHGTQVASTAAEGNPFIRLLVVRADYHMDPFYPTIDVAHEHAAAQKATVDYCVKAGVRVVNMSWSESRACIESYVEYSLPEGTAEERAKLARDFFKIISDSLFEAIRGAPNILFVTSAGNFSGDVEFDEVMPSMFVLPNLVTVGAVDSAGIQMEMSSYGERVKFFAKGDRVDSLVPGGGQMKFYGTSAAAPGVANLAAKLLAIDPTLTPSRLVRLMEEGADPLASDRSKLVINPKRTVEALRKRMP